MKKVVKVRNASEFELTKISLGVLYEKGSVGVESKGAAIDRATGFLQRLAQKTEWQLNEHAKCREYLGSLFLGSNLLDSFVLVPATLLLITVDNRIKSTTGEIKQAWEEVKSFLKDRTDNGVTQFIIDGQNRLFESIIPFFDNEIRLPDTSLVFQINDEETGEIDDVDVKNLFFEDLPPHVQDWIKQIKVPVAVGTKGDLERFCDTLIWKNEGIAWDDWQKMVTKNWFTKYLRQIRVFSDKDTSETRITDLLSKISGKPYEYDRNGWDRLISELLMWMVRGVEVKQLDEAKYFFDGSYPVTERVTTLLKKYLMEFAGAYGNLNKITNTELRNYIYLRYVLDNPKSELFDDACAPNWEIKKGVKFASYYKKYNALLRDDPERLGELPTRTYSKTSVGGKTLSAKTPGAYTTLCGQYGASEVMGRLEILFSVLAGRKSDTKDIFAELIKENVVVVLASDKTPSMAQIHENNPFTADGEKIDIVDYDNTDIFDIGHYTPKSQGGSNEDVVLQKKSQNRKLQDNPIPIRHQRNG
jgi:hypothetical protein